MAVPFLLIFICSATFVLSMMPEEVAGAAAVPPKDAQPGVVYFNTANYSQGSVYEQNLNKLLDILLMSTPLDVYKNASYGEYPDEVYGTSACFKTSFDNCRQCLKSNRDDLTRTAPYAVGGVHYTNKTNNACYLRYENYKIDGFVLPPSPSPSPSQSPSRSPSPSPHPHPPVQRRRAVVGAILVCCMLIFFL